MAFSSSTKPPASRKEKEGLSRTEAAIDAGSYIQGNSVQQHIGRFVDSGGTSAFLFMQQHTAILAVQCVLAFDLMVQRVTGSIPQPGDRFPEFLSESWSYENDGSKMLAEASGQWEVAINDALREKDGNEGSGHVELSSKPRNTFTLTLTGDSPAPVNIRIPGMSYARTLPDYAGLAEIIPDDWETVSKKISGVPGLKAEDQDFAIYYHLNRGQAHQCIRSYLKETKQPSFSHFLRTNGIHIAFVLYTSTDHLSKLITGSVPQAGDRIPEVFTKAELPSYESDGRDTYVSFLNVLEDVYTQESGMEVIINLTVA